MHRGATGSKDTGLPGHANVVSAWASPGAAGRDRRPGTTNLVIGVFNLLHGLMWRRTGDVVSAGDLERLVLRRAAVGPTPTH